MPKDFITARVYMKPLVPAGRAGANVSIEKLLQRSRRDLLRRLRANLLQTTFSPRAKAALQAAVSIQVKSSSLQVIAKHPAFRPLVEGQRPMQMRWLLRARAPIPIVLDSGKLIFRTATRKSMLASSLGKKPGWWHPGRQPSNYVEKAKAEMRKHIRERLLREIMAAVRQQLRQASLKPTRGHR